MIPFKHSLNILWKSKHFSQRYKKRDWVFFSEHSVDLYSTIKP